MVEVTDSSAERRLRRPRRALQLRLALVLGIAAWGIVFLTTRGVLDPWSDSLETLARERVEREIDRVTSAVARSGREVGETLERVADRLAERARSSVDADPIDAAERLNRLAGLDLLVVLDARGRVVSSDPWPERAGLLAPEFESIGEVPSTARLRDATGSGLAVMVRRSLSGGDPGGSLVGGRLLGRELLEAGGSAAALMLVDLAESGASPPIRAGRAEPASPVLAEVARAPDAGAASVRQLTGTSWLVGRRQLVDPSGTPLALIVVADEIGTPAIPLGTPGRFGLALAALAAVASGAAGWWAAGRFRRPVERLVRAVDAIAAGEADYTFPHAAQGELEELGAAFSRMQRALDEQRVRALAAERVAAWREVARHVAHEVKNPLVPIRLTVENLMRAKQRDPRLFDELFEEGSRTILEEVDQLRRLVGEFSEFARLPAPRRETVDVDELVDDVLELFRAEPGLRIERKREVGCAAIELDPDQIARALKNIVGNAVEALREVPRERRWLEVRTAISNDPIEITVLDHGPGFSMADTRRVFEPYFTTKRAGTGLGMAIAARIVTEHGGWITAANGAETGACVVIRLPREHSSGDRTPEAGENA